MADVKELVKERDALLKDLQKARDNNKRGDAELQKALRACGSRRCCCCVRRVNAHAHPTPFPRGHQYK